MMRTSAKSLLPVTALGLLAGCLLSASVAAQTAAPPEQPDTLVLSDTLTYDDARRESIFTGNVIMTRGTLKLLADRLVMHEDSEGFQYGTATVEPGRQVQIEQENPEKFEVLQARGARGEYNGKTEEIMVIGQAVVTRFICGKPFDTIKGEKIVYRQKTDTYQAYSGPGSASSDGRVRSLAKPRANIDAAVAECRRKAAGQ
ncbi:MAG: lipopolysaccharide transport periplasmic protein LptA [Castellaniella sp.]